MKTATKKTATKKTTETFNLVAQHLADTGRARAICDAAAKQAQSSPNGDYGKGVRRLVSREIKALAKTIASISAEASL